MNRSLRIGVALDLSASAPGLWDGDALQAAAFLAMALVRCAGVESCVALDGAPGPESDQAGASARSPLPVIGRQAAMQSLDLVIELDCRLPEDWSRAFAEKGGALVAQRIAADLVADSEAMAFARPTALLPAPNFYREIWVWPAYAAAHGSYLHYTTLAHVHVVPQLWSPAILEQTVQAQGLDWQYRPGRSDWRLAILEPNRSSAASCHLPLLLCDVAYRRQPELIAGLCVGDSAAMVDGQHFCHFVDSLDVVRQRKVQFFDAIPAFAVLGSRADALVSHHWGQGQSYRHYEALHGGFPLIHNAPLLGDCGYRYKDFDPEDGAQSLLHALHHHDADLAAYRAMAGKFLAMLDPASAPQVSAYEERLAALFPQT
ncbi:DUF2827 family protein [Novosphingobium rosa]|uniref:DUF2827 family protein n=1 Tax=Novosphingobium rosa TaxID=76978 RepID=UPI000835221F|nr:DUF2827 family protein [Novosphingobium rosa]